ncbi:MAG: glycosyltransferase, partial [bacterium]|nr:glycosyltransferase [bacterium]
LRFGFHPRQDIARWANNALACAYLPFDEDSVGYVTMEAFAAGKAVLTTTDSGGLLEIVNAETGALSDPTPEALAEALAKLTADPAKAAAKGRAARDLWRDKNVTWGETVRRLLD